MFLKSNGEQTEQAQRENAWAKILTAVDVMTRSPFAAALLRETPPDFVVVAAVSWLDGLGHVKIRLVSDGEPALVSLLEKCRARRASPTLLQTTPKASGASIGNLGNMQKRLQGQLRMMRSGKKCNLCYTTQ